MAISPLLISQVHFSTQLYRSVKLTVLLFNPGDKAKLCLYASLRCLVVDCVSCYSTFYLCYTSTTRAIHHCPLSCVHSEDHCYPRHSTTDLLPSISLSRSQCLYHQLVHSLSNAALSFAFLVSSTWIFGVQNTVYRNKQNSISVGRIYGSIRTKLKQWHQQQVVVSVRYLIRICARTATYFSLNSSAPYNAVLSVEM